MSDAFGSGQSDTATGGLVNDTPALGPSPASGPAGPRQVPSALGGLAQLFGGRPAPSPAMPGTSPYQAPGQSQIPQGPPKPPQRMTGTITSLALPQGSPQPPARFTPYIKSTPTRGFADWGDPQPFAALPQSFEVPSMYQGISSFFGQNGSQLAIPLALAMGTHAGDFIKGLQEGQEWKMKMAREKMQDAATQLQMQQEEEHHTYRDVFAEHAALENTTDPTKLDNEAMRADLAQAAYKLGDDKMTYLIENGAKLSEIMWFQQQRDANLQDLQKANTKTSEQEALDEQWGLKPATQGGGAAGASPSDWQYSGGGQAAGGGAATTTPGAAPSPGAPAPSQPSAAGQVAGPGAPSTPDQGQPESLIDSGAAEIFKGNEPGTYVPPDVKNAMAIKAADLRRRANAILTNPNIKPDQVMPEVEKQLGPTVAADLKGYSQYRAGPGATGQASGGKEQDYWNLLGDLSQKALPGDPANGKPGWNKSTYQAVRDFREQAQKPTSPIQRIPTSVEAANNVLNDLDAIQKKHGLVSINSPEDLQGWMGKDPLFSQLNIDWIRYNEDIDVLTRGTPSVGMAEQAIQTQPQFPYLGSLSGYRAAVRRDMDQAQSRVNEMHRTWDQYQTGDPMPGMNPQAERDMEAIKRLDFVTGAKPGDVKEHNGVRARYLGVNPEDPADQSNWEPVQ